MANMTSSSHEPEREPEEDPGTRPTKVNKPIGDAIPAPVEPGLDQPLPRKGETLPSDDHAEEGTDGTDIGDTETPPGVPPPGKSDFA